MIAKKAYKVIVSDRAKQMLGMHIRFIAQISKEAARKKKKQLTEAIRSLAFMPQRYPFFENPYIPHGKYHKMYVESWYLVLYQIKDDRVEVDYIGEDIRVKQIKIEFNVTTKIKRFVYVYLDNTKRSLAVLENIPGVDRRTSLRVFKYQKSEGSESAIA